MKTRAILVDNHALILIDMRYLLSAYDDLRVTAQAQDADGLLAQLEVHPCNLLTTDLMMPGNRQADGLCLVQKVRRRYPDLPIIVVTMLDNSTPVSPLLKLGIHGLVNKRGMLNDPPKAICHAGHRLFISNSIAHLLEMGEAEYGKPLANLEQLTPCEVEVLCLYGSGLAVGGIAIQLCYNKQTIGTRRSSTMRKLDLDSNAGLFIYIRENSLARAARPRYVRLAGPLRKVRAAAKVFHGTRRHPCPPPSKDSFHMDRNRRLSA